MRKIKQNLVNVFFLIAIMICITPYNAQAELKRQNVVYRHGNIVLEGYLVYDNSGPMKRPGVLVVHEWKGINSHVKGSADKLAQLGYVAFAIDMYGKGIRPKTDEEAKKIVSVFKNDRLLMRERVKAGLMELKRHPWVDAENIAAIGYCFGGSAVLELARSGADVRGVVSFHGGLNTPHPADANNIKAKILVLHGAQDPYVPETDVKLFETEMKNAHVYYKLIKYPGVVHSFTNPASGNDPKKGIAYDKKAAQESWEEMKIFLEQIFTEK